MNLQEIKKVHLIGIGGIGVSSLARFFVGRGASVSGSDVALFTRQKELEEKGVTIFIGHATEHVPEDVDLVVYSPAVLNDNVELLRARSLNILVLDYPSALGLLMKGHYGVAVSGTNGKTTTTGLLGMILEEGGKDPTVVVGGNIPAWKGNFREGKGNIFVAEGCEYKRSMMHLAPQMIVLTNIEADHLDYYKDIDDIKNAFFEYISKLSTKDILVFNADDPHVVDLCVCNVPALKVSFGLRPPVDLYPTDIRVDEGKQFFRMVWRGEDIGEFHTYLPGTFNIYNILAASVAALHLGVSPDAIRRVLENFRGAERRFEYVGKIGNTVVVSDYAHHPTAVKGTILAARSLYPKGKILAVFQPHQKDRTVKLFEEFIGSFDDADEVILQEIYEVAGRNTSEKEISSQDLVRAMKHRNEELPVMYSDSLTDLQQVVVERAKDFDLVLLMGAGDINKVVEHLKNI